MNQSAVHFPRSDPPARPGPRPGFSWSDPSPADTHGPTLSDVVNAIWRRKWLLMASNVALCALAFLVIKALPPQYSANAKVMIDPRRQLAAEMDPALASLRINPNTIETLESEAQVIKSRSVLEQALALAGPEPEDEDAGPGALCRLSRWAAGGTCTGIASAGDATGTGGPLCGVLIWLGGEGCITPATSDPAQEVRSLRSGVGVSQVGLSRIIAISYAAPKPGRAAEVANAVATAYVDHQRVARTENLETSRARLQDRLPIARAEVEQARQALEGHRSQALIDGRDAALLREQITTLGLSIGELRAEHNALASRIERARSLVEEVGPEGVFEVVGASALAQSYQQALSNLLQRRQERGREIGENHPEMIALQQQIRESSRQLARTAEAEFSALLNEGELAAERLAAAEDQLAALRRDLASIAGAEIKLRTLEQEVVAKQSTLDSLLQQAEQFSDVDHSRPVAWIVSEAEPPLGPDAPNKKLLFLIAIAGSLGLTLGGSLLLEVLERRYVVSLDTLKGMPNVDPLAILPISHSLDGKGRAIVDRKSEGIYAESLRRIYGSLIRPGPVRSQIVLVSSAEPGEGKTTFVAKFGRAAAKRGHRVLVVDCDFLRPALHRMFRLNNEGGFTSYFRSSGILTPYRVPGEDGLDIIVTGEDAAVARDSFFRQNVAVFLSQLRATYDLVIIDTPPTLAVADAKLLAPCADTVLLIVKWKSTLTAAVDAAVQELSQERNDAIKVVLNQVDLHQYDAYCYNSYPARRMMESYAVYHPVDDAPPPQGGQRPVRSFERGPGILRKFG